MRFPREMEGFIYFNVTHSAGRFMHHVPPVRNPRRLWVINSKMSSASRIATLPAAAAAAADMWFCDPGTRGLFGGASAGHRWYFWGSALCSQVCSRISAITPDWQASICGLGHRSAKSKTPKKPSTKNEIKQIISCSLNPIGTNEIKAFFFFAFPRALYCMIMGIARIWNQ